ncbi:MAG: hypothetical protein ACKOAP_05230, partial [Vulcanococcus sp.]
MYFALIPSLAMLQSVHADRVRPPLQRLKRLLFQPGRSFLLSSALLVPGVLGLSLSAQAAGLIKTLSFQGTTFSSNAALNGGSGSIPPDTMGASGLTQFLESSNGSISVYDRSNGALRSRVNLGTFWSAVSPNLSNSGGDQRVLFDHYTQRWIVIGFGATRNVINIAVSDGSSALGGWRGTTLPVLTSGSTADYPTLGMDDRGVYIATNNFNASGSFTGTSLFVLSKAELFDGS